MSSNHNVVSKNSRISI